MSCEKFQDFGKPVYRRNPGIVLTYHGDDKKEDQVQVRPGQDVPKLSSRASLNFGNISVTNLKRSLNEQLLEKEKKTEHESKSPTDGNKSLQISTPRGVFDNQMPSAGSSLYYRKGSDAIKSNEPVQPKASREIVNLNKSVTIKRPLLDDFSGVSVKNLSTSLIRLKLKEVLETERPKCDQGEDIASSEFPHEHCLSCFDKNCQQMKHCPVVRCKNKCGEAIFHRCKQREHDEMCKYTIIPCINKTSGCQMEMPRYKIWYHLKHCTKMTEAALRPKSVNLDRLSGDYQRMISREKPSVKYKDIHEHCLHCYDIRCSQQEECVIKRCSNKGCSMKLHACKIREHKRRICLFREIPCINKEYGCQYKFSKVLLTEHLRVCPAMNFEALGLPPYNLFQNTNEQSHHCENCYDSHCAVPVDKKCMMRECDCGAILHACKWKDHYENTCPAYVMCCINFDAGCKMTLTRGMLPTHLFHCPAMNWKYRTHHPSEDGSDQSDYSTMLTVSEYTAKDDSDEHVYEELPKRKRKRNRSCKVM
jgi:hypothetical protein